MAERKNTGRGRKPSTVDVRYGNGASMVESIVFTRAQSGGSIYRQRFLLRLIQLAQAQIRANMPAVLGCSRIYFNDWNDPVIEMPVRYLLRNENDQHHTRAKESILDFSRWRLVYEDLKVFRVTPVLVFSSLDKTCGVLQFRVTKEMWECMFNFSKGYSVYNLAVAMSLNNELALKIYKGLEKQDGSMYYTFDGFRRAFGFLQRYVGRNHDLVVNMIEPAKKELDEKSPWTFEYELDYGYEIGKARGRKSLRGITIKPVKQLGKSGIMGLFDDIHPSDVVGQACWHILTDKLGFSPVEVKINLFLFEQAVCILGVDGFGDWLDSIVPSAVRAEKSVQGYVINALKIYLDRKTGTAPARDSSPGDSGMTFTDLMNMVFTDGPEGKKDGVSSLSQHLLFD